MKHSWIVETALLINNIAALVDTAMAD